MLEVVGEVGAGLDGVFDEGEQFDYVVFSHALGGYGIDDVAFGVLATFANGVFAVGATVAHVDLASVVLAHTQFSG